MEQPLIVQMNCFIKQNQQTNNKKSERIICTTAIPVDCLVLYTVDFLVSYRTNIYVEIIVGNFRIYMAHL